MSQTETDAPTPATVSSVFDNILSGLESGIFAIVLGVLSVFMPKMISLGANDLLVIGNNFRLFLTAIGSGTPWGQALSDMLTADWNSVEASAQEVGTDFAEAVATALEQYGVLPQGK
jgi:hypothetical protein